ncbi:MAG: FHA domain-containing protein [Nocardioides sp.]|nr:FHA domain-containing protein [Nocardioides sp.]
MAIDGAHPLAIADPDFSISKVHVVLRPVAAGLEVIDQGSTNGTALVHEGHEQPLTAGEVGVAKFGDTIRIGERTARVLGS